MWIISGIHAGVYGGTLIALNETWYQDYPKTSFHTFDDSREWLQMDKIGHGWGAYNIARGSSAMWKWTGFSQKRSDIFGSMGALGYMTVIEVLDAHSAKWGWSWADMIANVSGAGIYLGQQLAWKEQRIQFKFSSHPVKYEGELKERANNLYGNSYAERLLKDYNGQTYWFSANLHSFTKNEKLPRWLNIAVGYSADGMFGGFENKWTDVLGNEKDFTHIKRVRQFYLSPDIDLTKIKTSSKALRTIFQVFSVIKVPAPALMLNSDGKVKFEAIYF